MAKTIKLISAVQDTPEDKRDTVVDAYAEIITGLLGQNGIPVYYAEAEYPEIPAGFDVVTITLEGYTQE